MIEVHSKREIRQKLGFTDLVCTRDTCVEDTEVEVIRIMVKPWEWVNLPNERT